MIPKQFVSIYAVDCIDGVNFHGLHLQSHPASRATRLVDDPTRYLLVSLRKKAKDEILREAMLHWIRVGITMNNVRYRFFGFTESHVKTGKLVFFREDQDWTVDRVLKSFGDLQSVFLKSGYGKYSARLGLSFSSTLQSLDVPDELTLQIPDITAPDGSLHSDGCGMIRDSFAAQICTRHEFPADTTVFQIRRGGIKGLLVRYPNEKFDQLCQRHCSSAATPLIAYRPSMREYEGGPIALELNKHNSPPAAARLNIQFTVLLLTLGVPLKVFERLVQDQLDLIGSIVTDRQRALAYIQGELDAGAEDSLFQGLYTMLLARHELSEPIVRARLQEFQKYQYDSLRKKMNLRVQDSCYLFGVVDEEGILAPDQVYINLPTRGGVLVRDVIVARNPSYHPGDLRKLHAVDRSELRHHRNCIVFSSTGLRSVPDTIASGDLDGDMYFVAWDPSLVPSTEAQPLDRGKSLSASIPGEAIPAPARDTADMPAAAVDTFIQLRYSRLLGMMANEWTKQVEINSELAYGPYPLELVPMIESALDIMKSGDDFTKLEAKFKRMQARHNTRSLDGLVSPIQHLRDMIPQTTGENETSLSTTQCDPALILKDEDPSRWNHYISEARRVMPSFNNRLSSAIKLDQDADVDPEDGPASTLKSRNDHDGIPRNADIVKREYQYQYFGGGNTKMRFEQQMRASAWYYYGYSQNKQAFAWLGMRYLNELKAYWTNGNRPPMFVGASDPRLAPMFSSPLVREGSQETLVASDGPDEPLRSAATGSIMDVDASYDTETEEDVKPTVKASASVECPRQRRSASSVDPPGSNSSRSSCRAASNQLPRVSVRSNPKPLEPVATPCDWSCPDGHKWNITANGFARRYLCQYCGLNIQEKKKDGYWVRAELILCERRESPRRVPPPRTTRRSTFDSPPSHDHPALSAISEREEAGATDEVESDSDDDDAMSIYESAEENEPEPSPVPRVQAPPPDPPGPAPRRSSAGRSSLGTVSSDAPSSLANFPSIRRLPARAGSDVSSPVGRPRQISSGSRRTSGSALRTPLSPVQSELPPTPRTAPSPPGSPSCWPLVSDYPKPPVPVVPGHYPRFCPDGSEHLWSIDWANQTHRRYKCAGCGRLTKERKTGLPERWSPAD